MKSLIIVLFLAMVLFTSTPDAKEFKVVPQDFEQLNDEFKQVEITDTREVTSTIKTTTAQLKSEIERVEYAINELIQRKDELKNMIKGIKENTSLKITVIE